MNEFEKSFSRSLFPVLTLISSAELNQLSLPLKTTAWILVKTSALSGSVVGDRIVQ